jgi:hypothetical protein
VTWKYRNDTLNKQKCLFLKTENRKSCLGVGTSERGKDMRKGCRRVNMVEILYTHVCIWKNKNCGNYSKNGRSEGEMAQTMYAHMNKRIKKKNL